MSITFAQPAALLLLFLLPVLAVLKLWSNRRARVRVSALVAKRLISSLVTGRNPALSGALFAFELAALGCFIIALAQPRYGFLEKEVEGEGRSVMIAIDTSRSMLAKDLEPDRITRALLAAHDLVLSLPNDRIGVIAFAGRAFVQAPLTIDHAAVLETLSQLDTSIIARGGTNVSEAIGLAIETFDKVESANHALIIFTDGDELEGDALTAARQAFEKNVMIITIGVGTRMGSVIPDRKNRTGKGYVVDAAGNVVRTALNSEKLEQLARATRGLYLRLDSGEVAGALVKKALENLDKVTVTSQQATRVPIERYRWPLAAGVVLLVGSWVGMLGMTNFRRFAGFGLQSVERQSLVVLLGLVLLVNQSEAGVFQLNPYSEMAAGRHGTAVELLSRQIERAPNSSLVDEWRFARGTAAFRSGDFDLAIEDFANTLLCDDALMQEQSHYNLANAIAKKASLRSDEEEIDGMVQDINDAIEHYDAALEMNPRNGDAIANREALVKFLEELEKAKEEAGGQGDPSQDSNQGEGSSEGEGNPGDGDQSSTSKNAGKGEGDQGDGNGQPGEGDSGQGEQNDGGQQGSNEQEPGEGGGSGEEDEENGDDSQLEGELKALKQNGEQGKQPEGRRAGGSGRDKKDPRTGFSPSEARQLLRALADEDRSIRPTHGKPAKEGEYKDW